jgi:hypothetical protein
MIFNYSDAAQNSLLNARERNFYVKILGGFVFNELIKSPSFERRINAFLEIIPMKLPYSEDESINEAKTLRELLGIDSVLTPENSSLSFDNHLASANKQKEEVPEFADIALWLPGKRLLAIEAKYTENWSSEKDIKANIKNVSHTLKRFYSAKYYNYDISHAVFALLILERKLYTQKNNKRSVLKKITTAELGEFDIPACIITWDGIMEIMQKHFGRYKSFKRVKAYYDLSLIEMEEQKRISVVR